MHDPSASLDTNAQLGLEWKMCRCSLRAVDSPLDTTVPEDLFAKVQVQEHSAAAHLVLSPVASYPGIEG